MSSNELFLTEGMQKLPALEFFPLITDPYASYRNFFSPDESLIARDFGISQNNASHVVKVWQLSNGKLINTFDAGEVAISTDNHLIAIGQSERDYLSQHVQSITYLYDLQTGEELGRWQGGRPIFLSNNSLVLEANGYTRIFDPGKHKSRRVFAGKQAVFSSDEQLVALWERSYINVYRVSDGQLLSRFKLELPRIDEITMRFSPDGQVLAGYTGQPECCAGYTDNLSLWRVEDGALIKKLRPSRNFVFSPDSQTISVGGREVLRTSDGSLIADLQQTCESPITNLVFTPDGQQIIVDCYVLYLYPANGGSPWVPQKVDRETYLPILEAASLSNWQEVPSPDGKFLARKGKVSNLIVVSSISGEAEEFYIPGAKVTRFAFSPDHQILAVGLNDGSVDLWDVNRQRSVYTIPPQILTLDPSSVNGLAFSPDGKSLVISVSDDTIRLYGINAN
jgi:WD40 repeat protein